MSRIRAIVAAGLAVAALLAATGCDVLEDATSGVRGSGDLATERREVGDFTQIALAGTGEVQVEITGTESLVVTAENNLHPLLRTEVVDGRLEIEPTERITATEPIVYTITAAELEGVSIAGSGTVNVTGLDGGTFTAEIGGSGTIQPEGRVDELTVRIAGSGTFDGESLVASTGSVEIAGSGDAVVDVTDALSVTIAGSGNVEYLGDPQLSQSITGSGEISRR
jgi:hypothetical protein